MLDSKFQILELYWKKSKAKLVLSLLDKLPQEYPKRLELPME